MSNISFKGTFWRTTLRFDKNLHLTQNIYFLRAIVGLFSYPTIIIPKNGKKKYNCSAGAKNTWPLSFFATSLLLSLRNCTCISRRPCFWHCYWYTLYLALSYSPQTFCLTSEIWNWLSNTQPSNTQDETQDSIIQTTTNIAMLQKLAAQLFLIRLRWIKFSKKLPVSSIHPGLV